ncbi:disA bacterial checkpoint controller linker region family protein [Mycobacterium ulcerans str. Harvey]|uniref:DisA bacterial checkpoint controller linker region family protein n=1 Tax=Mycobacterium ulcerans str. Harvey TaxID=1299332 RepID=A0ABN0RA40_MYCUL|nr:disA bacterial checkpoint controller linker region family protein [Mycobacterium ulcerans str. Harvey]
MTLRDVMTVVQRLELVRRIGIEIDNDVVELGTDGRQLRLQLEELLGDNETAGVDCPGLLRQPRTAGHRTDHRDPRRAGCHHRHRATRFQRAGEDLRISVHHRGAGLGAEPRGYRAMSGIPRLQFSHTDLLVRAFGSLHGLLAASASDLQSVEGIGSTWAPHVREGLSQLAESTIADQ